MNTTITRDQIVLKDNEVYVIDKTALIWKSDWIYDSFMEIIWQAEHDSKAAKQFLYKITHSTAKLDGVIHLNREWFVKGEDIRKLAIEEFGEDKVNRLVVSIFEAGYSAKKGEFTLEQLMNVAYAASNHGMFDDEEHAEKYVRDCINHFQPLSLPEKIVLSPDGELIEIQW